MAFQDDEAARHKPAQIGLCAALLLLAAGIGQISAEERGVPGLQGAIPIPFTLDEPSVVSIGLYTPEGQLVRVLGQGMRLESGQHRADWDGMDLWGRLLPVGTQLEAKVYHHPGLKAFYEFNLGADDWDPASRPWAGLPYGEGDEQRTGAWLSDHTGPKAIAVAGNRVVVATNGAEAADNIMILNHEGIKMYGMGGLGGFGGSAPAVNEMWPYDDDHVVLRSGNRFITLNVRTKKFRTIGSVKGKLFAATVKEGQIHSLNRPTEESLPALPLNRARAIAKRGEPQVIGEDTVQFQQSPERRFASTLTNSSHFQTGITVKVNGGLGYLVAPFEKPITVGSVMIPKIDKAKLVEVFVLREDLSYDMGKHHPFQGSEMEDDLGIDMGVGLSPLDSSDAWVKFGEGTNSDLLNIINGDDEPVQTKALLLRISPLLKKEQKGKKKKTVEEFHLTHVLPFAKRHKAVGKPKIRIDSAAIERTYKKHPQGWDFKASWVPQHSEPVTVLLDYGKPVEMDVLTTWGQRSPAFKVHVLEGDVDPATARDDQWRQVPKRVAGPSKITGDGSNRERPKMFFIDLPKTMAVRAIRLEYFDGIRRGKDGVRWLKAQPQRINLDHFQAIKLVDETRIEDTRGQPAYHTVIDVASGKQIKRELTYGGDVTSLAAGGTDDFFAFYQKELVRMHLDGDVWKHTTVPLDSKGRQRKRIQRVGDELAVIHRGPVVLLDAQTGTQTRVLGGWDGYERGPWDRNSLERVASIAGDAKGEYWLVESSWYPKRVARFNKAGECVWNVNGQPEYGGGGFIHPDFKSFHYRGMEWDIDYEAGTSHMTALNDRPYTEETPDPGRGFGYTRAGRIIQYEGYDYAVHDGSYISVRENGVFRPVMIWGWANKSNFLTAPEKAWHEHWRSQNLQGKFFVWLDDNADGKYQIDEVRLLDKGIYKGMYWGARIGDDLTLWSTRGRWQHRGIGPRGVPKFDVADFQSWDLSDRFPIYRGLSEAGSRACGWPNWFGGGSSMVTAGGKLSYLWSPYLFNEDLTVFGGEPDVSGGGDGYQPEVMGLKIHHPLGYSGGASADGAVDEVLAITGNLGRMTFIAGQDRLVLDQLFTGTDGDISAMEAVRGIDASGRVLYYENFFSHFLRVNDGRHFFQSGQNSHALFRIEGLNDIKLQKQMVTVSQAAHDDNAVVRVHLVQDWRARMAAKAKKRQVYVMKPKERFGRDEVIVNGDIDEWGNFERMQAIDESYSISESEPRMYFDAVRTKKGMVMAFAGFNHTLSSSNDPREIFSAGFAFDLRFRIKQAKDKSKSSRARSADKTLLTPGDTRIVFGKIGDDWRAVLFDYVDDENPGVGNVTFASPHVETRIDNMRLLGEDEVTIKVVPEALLAINQEIEDDRLGAAAVREAMTRAAPSERGNYTFWTAEVLIPWKLLEFGGEPRGGKIDADVGIIGGKSDGSDAGERWHWASPRVPQTVSDIGAEAAIDPRTWGTFSFFAPED